jgi:hypothetical protein
MSMVRSAMPLDRLGRDGVAVTAGHQALSLLVAKDDPSGLIAQYEAQWESVEGLSQPDGLSTGFAHGGGRCPSGLFEVTQRRLDLAVVIARLDAESRRQCHQALGDCAVASTTVDEHADENAQEQDSGRRQIDGD